MSYIILKFDDLDENTVESFKKAQAICEKHNAVPCFGLIGRSLEDPSEEYVSSLRGMIESGVELWNHGYYHTEKEFSECTYQQQKDSIEGTQLLMEKHLGTRAATFGSPHNNSTEKTVQVLTDHFPEIRNRFYMADGEGRSDARSLLMRCNYEVKTGEIDLDFFKKEYERIKEYPYFVMQGHPSFWSDEDAIRFDEILGILSDDGNKYVTAEGLRKVIFPGYLDISIDGLINEVEAFFARNKETYFYGAGEIGREAYRFFDKKGFRPDGFLVSDGHRAFPDVCGVPVYELHEARDRKDIGIIPTILGRSHASVFADERFKNLDVWMPKTKEQYDRMIDYIRFDLYYDKDIESENECIKAVRDRIMDDESQRIFFARLMFSLTGNTEYLSDPARLFKEKVMADERWKEFVRTLKESENTVGLMLYGAGSFGEKLLDMTPDVSWKRVIDKSPSSDMLQSVPVVSLAGYLKGSGKESIVISSKRYYEDIRSDLQSCGIPEERIIDGTVIYDLTEGAQYFDLKELPHSDEREIFLDVGCCDGMSSVAFMKWCEGNGFCYCFEPDEKNIRLLERILSDKGLVPDRDYSLIRKGAWDKETELSFVSSGDHTSHVTEGSGGSKGPAADTIPVTTIDEAVDGQRVTFIKMDIEGSELKALHGAKSTITEYKPKLAISLYHKPEDVWEIPAYIMELRPDYRFYIRHYSFDVYETVLYAF